MEGYSSNKEIIDVQKLGLSYNSVQVFVSVRYVCDVCFCICLHICSLARVGSLTQKPIQMGRKTKYFLILKDDKEKLEVSVINGVFL